MRGTLLGSFFIDSERQNRYNGAIMLHEPIIALATPPFKGALALIRLSGEGVFEITERFFSKPIQSLTKQTLVYGDFSKEGHLIDQVVLLLYPRPHSMTGEDVVEISCHGSMVIVNEIIEAYLSCGVRYATRGEFTSRAFYAGKMDLVEAEAVNDVINATTREAKNIALLSLSGKTGKLVAPLKEEIASLLALIEVGIDFPEYDEEEKADSEKLHQGVGSLRKKLSILIARGEEGKVYRNGVKVAIIGKPNVGKSSLLNALLEQDKAIVSSVPGTTRDVVEGDLSIKGVPIHLLDTAGIRDAEDAIERLGVERSKKSIEESDLVLFVTEAGKELDEEEKGLLELIGDKDCIYVENKADLQKGNKEGAILLSAIQGNVDSLKEAIFDKLGLSENAYEIPSLSNARELALLRKIDNDLKEVEENIGQGLPLDLLSASLLSAYNEARQLLGEDATQDLTDEIFSRFCVGK